MRGRIPKHCEHRATGRGFVRLGGKQVYTGRWGTQEAATRYERLVAEWMLAGRQEARQGCGEATMLDLIDQWAKKPPTAAKFWPSLTASVRKGLVATRTGGLTPERFTPKAFKLLRQSWIDRGLCRRMVNEHGLHLRAMLKWAVAEELCPVATLQGVRAVGSVRRGAPGVRDREPVAPVPADVLEATRAKLSPRHRDMVDLQLLTGMRPGELCAMRLGDLDRSGEVWAYRPAAHKNAWRGKTRAVSLGPRAQEILRPYIERAATGARLNPAVRSFPLFPAVGKAKPITLAAYYNAVARAARRAGREPWGLNRLRHNAATNIRREFGLEAAQVVLGHANARITEIYAEVSRERADAVAKQIG
jgi:integrase